MGRREKAVWGLLCAALVAALAVPAKGLLIDGVYSWHVGQPEFLNMAWETAGLALILGAVWFLVDSVRRRLLMTGVVCAVFVWCHVVFLPMAVSAVYVLILYLVGHAVRTRLFRCTARMKDGWLWELLLGCGGMITLFVLLSLAGVGSIPVLQAAVCVAAIAAAAAEVFIGGPALLPARRTGQEREKLTKVQSLMVAFMIVAVLIQVGRMNISLDFDSLWYGLRSEFILDNGHGIYENMGTVGLVYTYSKGLEVLLLPLANLASYSYITFFNIWMTVLSLAAVYRIGRFYMGRSYALLAAACVSSIPAVMNMSITAKTDSMTLTVQLVMVLYLLHYLRERQGRYLIAALGALFLSWTLKPTALVFSTAVFGMSFLYLVCTGRFSLRAPWRDWLGILFPAAALAGIWGRTLYMVGIPVTSVFSSIFTKLGFQLNYPFAVLPLNGGGAPADGKGFYLADTLYRMFLNPSEESMSHVVIAWGTSLLFFLAIAAILTTLLLRRGTASGRVLDPDADLVHYAHAVMLPFVPVCLISLMMLGQIDGNYFMLLDAAIVLYGCAAISRVSSKTLRKSILIMTVPILLLNIPVTMVSNWAWSLGYTPVDAVNKGRMNHKAMNRQEMADAGNAGIWELLAANPQTRVIAAGSHPEVFKFPCNVQSYDDIISTWGNVVLVKTMDNFIEYLDYAKTDYVYMEAGYVEAGSRCHELMGYLIEAGIMTDVFYENGNLLARVNLQGTYGPEASAAYETYLKDYPVK